MVPTPPQALLRSLKTRASHLSHFFVHVGNAGGLALKRTTPAKARSLRTTLIICSTTKERNDLKLFTPATSGRLNISVRRYDIWDRLGNFRELQLVDSYLGNYRPITTHDRYPHDPENQTAER